MFAGFAALEEYFVVMEVLTADDDVFDEGQRLLQEAAGLLTFPV